MLNSLIIVRFVVLENYINKTRFRAHWSMGMDKTFEAATSGTIILTVDSMSLFVE